MDVFAALADPVRRDLVAAVAAAPMSAGALADRHPISRPATSRHLRVLVDAGVLRASQDGRRRLFQLDPSALDDVRSYLASLDAAPVARFAAAFDALDTEVARTRRERRLHGDAGTTRHPDAGTAQEDTA